MTPEQQAEIYRQETQRWKAAYSETETKLEQAQRAKAQREVELKAALEQAAQHWEAFKQVQRESEEAQSNYHQREVQLKNAMARTRDLLRYVVYQRLPLGDTVFDHLDFERQKQVSKTLEDKP